MRVDRVAGRTSAKVARERQAEALPAAPAFTHLLRKEADEPALKKSERTRRRVLYATAVALEVTPFAALNMDQIAKAADVSRAALYQYVGSKEDAVRAVLNNFHSRTLLFPATVKRGQGPLDAIVRTNRYYIEYFARNAVFMERIRELHLVMPELIAERQRVNREWAAHVMRHVLKHRQEPLPRATLQLRILALECMIDDVLREIFVIRNPDLVHAARDLDALALELSAIWHKVLYD